MATRPGTTSLEHRLTAAGWHEGHWSPLYAYASTSDVFPGLDDEIRDCLDYIERSGPLADFDPVHEHARLTSLLHQVEPELAALNARAIGRTEGHSAMTEWQQDAHTGPRSDRVETASRLRRAIDDGDPGLLDELPGESDELYIARRVEVTSGWLEPGMDDQPAHDHWAASRSRIWEAYRSGFHDSVMETADAWSRAVLEGTPIPPAGLTERYLSSARYLGAEAALTDAATHRFSNAEAQAVIRGHYEIIPASRQSESIPASRITDRETVAALGHTLPTVEAAIADAWGQGWDSVWELALRATALRAVGDDTAAQNIDNRNNTRLQALEHAAGPFPIESQPYLRPSPLDRPNTSGRTAPEGWVVEQVGEWHGQPHEVVYDARRFEVTVTASEATALNAAPGWNLQGTDGPRGFWTKDRAAAARSALDRFADQALGADTPQRGATANASDATRTLEL
jgi:hypothetical protein